MANLLPRKQKRLVKLDYRLRFYTVGLFMFTISGIFSMIYLTPFYRQIVRAEEEVLNRLVVHSRALRSNKAQIDLATVGLTRNKQKILEANLVGQTPHSALDLVLIHRTPDITISSWTSNRSGQVTFSGFAKTREDYNTFIQALRADPKFTDLDYPISSFAKSTDIDFVIKLKIIYE